MTRTEALNIAISAVKSSDLDDDTKETAVRQLQRCVKSVQNKKWSEEKIFAACDKVVAEKGVLLTSDFNRSGMPSRTAVKNVFGMTATTFRDLYYPVTGDVSALSPYRGRDVSEWSDIFIGQYRKIAPRTQDEYNARRDPATPTWLTIAKMNGCANWTQLLLKLGLKNPPIRSFTVTSTSHSQMMLDAATEKIQRRNRRETPPDSNT